MRKANNTVSCDSTQNSKLLLYTVNVSDPPPPPAFCVFPSFVINMRVSFYPLCLRELCDLVGILFINDNARGFISQTGGVGGRLCRSCAGDPHVATRNNSWKMKSGGISVSVISAAHVAHQSPSPNHSSQSPAANQPSVPHLLCGIHI